MTDVMPNTAENQDPFKDGCPLCQAVRTDAPEGVDRNGDPAWVYDYCWKCGYRPESVKNQTVALQAEQFRQFQQWLDDQNKKNGITDHPTMNAPDDAERANMEAKIAELESQLAARNSPGGLSLSKVKTGDQTQTPQA